MRVGGGGSSAATTVPAQRPPRRAFARRTSEVGEQMLAQVIGVCPAHVIGVAHVIAVFPGTRDR